MKNECSIVKDLLPLYAENMVSEDTKNFVGEHLKNCKECHDELEKLKEQENKKEFEIEKPLKTLKKELTKKRIITVIISVLVTLALGIVIWTGLTSPKYFKYSDDLIDVSENVNGSVTIRFFDPVTNYDCNSVHDPDTGKNIYFIEAWNITLDKLTGPYSRTMELQIDDENFLVFYSQNNGEDDVLIYGEAPKDFGGVISLPRLYMNYYLVISIAAAIILIVIAFILEKTKGKTKLVQAINFIIPLPICYVLAHICSLLTSWSAYSAGRFLITNISLQIIFFCINRLIIKLIKLKQETKQIQ